jgi:hypothetical protein
MNGADLITGLLCAVFIATIAATAILMTAVLVG